MSAPFTQRGKSCGPMLQSLWDHVRSEYDCVLLSPYLPVLCAFLTHVTFCAPFLLLDLLAPVSQRVRAWKISAKQPPPPLRAWLKCLGKIAVQYLTVLLPASALLQISRRPSQLPEWSPSSWQLFTDVFVCFLLFDALFFSWHLCLHRIPWLYRNVHQEHHQHHAPFALQAQDASTSELLSLLLLAQISACLVNCHPLSQVVFHIFNTWLAVEDHCGYNLPWALHRLLPFYGGAPHHHIHHQRHNVNFAPYFTHWDHLFGTYRRD
ncbi:cholesterol 25-hydroxylase-like protein [Hippocampus zosterae]|uniref:cholesterol 25-hydroxylase-like protein n=1 Tax=Hippocampus zosterae TaxID=109293 RepID=UPI00223E79D6|nr:cholesterol 25-hydroxylase-like protein [Hippocampus zosterae]